LVFNRDSFIELGCDYFRIRVPALVQRRIWSQWSFAGVFVLVGLPYAAFWWWVKNRVKLDQIRNGKRLAKKTKACGEP
jgi:hypothetical protein